MAFRCGTLAVAIYNTVMTALSLALFFLMIAYGTFGRENIDERPAGIRNFRITDEVWTFLVIAIGIIALVQYITATLIWFGWSLKHVGCLVAWLCINYILLVLGIILSLCGSIVNLVGVVIGIVCCYTVQKYVKEIKNERMEAQGINVDVFNNGCGGGEEGVTKFGNHEQV